MKDDRRSKRSRAWLLETLLELMEEKDYADIGIKELTERADVARQTFYRNFRSKDDILLLQMDEVFDEFFATVRETLGQKGGDTAAMMKKLFYIWKRHESLFTALQKAGLTYRTLDRFSSYVSLIQAQIEAETEARNDYQRYLSIFVAGGTFMVLNTWFQKKMDMPVEDMGGLFDRIMQFLIATTKEYSRIHR